MKKTKKKKTYFPNNWQAVKEAPHEVFDELDFEVFMEWRGDGWELPPGICCVIREQNTNTLKTKEHVYKRPHAARTKLKKLLTKDDTVTTFCTEEAVVSLSLNPLLNI
jgi:predicted metal-binding protein